MNIQPLDQATIDEIKTRLVKTYNPRAIYMLEPIREDNVDIAIIIIVDGDDIQHYELMTKGHRALIGIKVSKNILVYTSEEFEKYSQDTSTLSYIVKKYGKKIYARA